MTHFKIDSVCEGISFRPERVRIADRDGESYWESIGARSNREKKTSEEEEEEEEEMMTTMMTIMISAKKRWRL